MIMEKAYGIDISEHNGSIPWADLKEAGQDFVIIRLGYGRGHKDSLFEENVKAAMEHQIPMGVYYYSYALSEAAARKEAEFVIYTLQELHLGPSKLAMGVWYDMEDSDFYKERFLPIDIEINPHYRQQLTNFCSTFVNTLWRDGYYHTGVYANYDWWTNYLYEDQLHCSKWCAQYNDKCHMKDSYMWQYTDKLLINNQYFDGNYIMPFKA